jgi:hypothetical protein
MAAAAAAAGSPFLTKLGADTADARLAASGSWGKVIIMPMNSGDEPAICATVASANGGNGVHNCPSLTAVAAGEIVLPIWDSIGATIGFVGVVPDGIASVKDVDTGQTLPIKNNVYVLLGQTQPPGTLVFTKTDGSTVQRTRLAAGAAPVAP